MNTSIDTLRRLVKVEDKIDKKFQDIVYEKQGLETHLAKIYAPITTAQAATTKAVETIPKSMQQQQTEIDSLLNVINETPLLFEIDEILKNYPNVEKHILNPSTTALTQSDQRVYDTVIKLPKSKLDLLKESIIRRQAKKEEEEELPPLETQPGTPRRSSSETSKPGTPLPETSKSGTQSPETPAPKEEPEDESDQFKKDIKEGKVTIINGLPWGSITFNDILSNSSLAKNEEHSIEYGILWKPPNNDNLYLGNRLIRSNTNNEVVLVKGEFNNEIIIPESTSNDIWNILTKTRIPKERYSMDTIYWYLVLIHESSIILRDTTEKAIFIGNYVKKYEPKGLSKVGPIDISSSIDYYSSLEKKVKKGKGLGLNYQEQQAHELTRLLGAHKAGNTNVYNEINDIVDQLRRSNIISIADSKKIYKSLKSK